MPQRENIDRSLEQLGMGSGSEQRDVRIGDQNISFVMDRFSSDRDLAKLLVPDGTDRLLVVADAGVHADRVAAVVAHLERLVPTSTFRIAPSEGVKQLDTVGQIAGAAIAFGCTRRSCLVAMGGGVVGNMVGLSASLLFRGVAFTHAPTTLMAMSDSVISVKQAVNAGGAKNLLGTYFGPAAVVIDLRFLDTLPQRAYRSALCESIKNLLTCAPDKVREFEALVASGEIYADAGARWAMELALEEKSARLRQDPKEVGPGIVFEYGHTVGHAVELAGRGRVNHGEAVAVGMCTAARIAVRLGHAERTLVDLHEHLLDLIGVSTRVPSGIDSEEILKSVLLDNKRGHVASSGIPMVLLNGPGRIHIEIENSLLTPVDSNLIRGVISSD